LNTDLDSVVGAASGCGSNVAHDARTGRIESAAVAGGALDLLGMKGDPRRRQPFIPGHFVFQGIEPNEGQRTGSLKLWALS
jgi:hypothetical protein